MQRAMPTSESSSQAVTARFELSIMPCMHIKSSTGRRAARADVLSSSINFSAVMGSLIVYLMFILFNTRVTSCMLRADAKEAPDSGRQSHRQCTPESDTDNRHQQGRAPGARSNQTQKCKKEQRAAGNTPHECGGRKQKHHQQWQCRTCCKRARRGKRCLHGFGERCFEYPQLVARMCCQRVMRHQLRRNGRCQCLIEATLDVDSHQLCVFLFGIFR